MRNFTTRLPNGGVDFYREHPLGWELPQRYWNYTRTDLNTTNITWVDMERYFPGHKTSIGAVVTLPHARSTVYENGTELQFQDSLIVPCMVDVRWGKVAMSFDPRTDGVVQSNLSDPEVLAPYFEEAFPWGLTTPSILISPAWASQLDVPVSHAWTGSGVCMNGTTSMRRYFSPFIINDTFDNGEPFTTFLPPKFNTSDIPGLHKAMEETTATILSLAVADGVSRSSYQYGHGLVLRDNLNDTVLWADTFHQAGGLAKQPSNINSTDLEGYTPLRWVVNRYGWAYGPDSITIKFGIAVLLIHAAMVVLYALHMAWFRFDNRALDERRLGVAG